MPKPDRFDERLQCHVYALDYDFVTRAGTLHMAGGNCCDMTCCTRMFEAIDPGVVEIRTISGGVDDKIYRRKGAIWQCFT